MHMSNLAFVGTVLCAIHLYTGAYRKQFVDFAVKNDFMSARVLLKKAQDGHRDNVVC